MGGTVTIFDPNGNKGEVPYGNLAAAVKAGGKLAVTVKAPDGTMGEIPADRVPDAAKAGGTVVPFQDQTNQHPGFWHAMWSDLSGMAGGVLKTAANVAQSAAGNPAPMTQQIADTAQTVSDNMQHRQDEGRSLAYRTIAPVGDVLGVNTRGMEDAADEGDFAGVAGHAAAPVVAMAATEGLTKGAPAAAEAAKPYFDAVKRTVENVTPRQVAATIGGAGGAVAGHGPLSAPGAYYGAKTGGKIAEGVLGSDRANTPIFAGKPMEQPAPFPETPAPELMQARPLATGGAAPPTEPAAALGRIPTPEPLPAQLPAAFQPLPPKPPAVPGTVDLPFKSLHELPVPAVQQALTELGPKAPIEALTQRANQLANQWPPEAAQVKAQKVSPTAEDALDDKAVEEQIRNAASAEDQARLREIYGANRLGSDVSTPKGRLTGTMGEGSDVYIRDRSGDKIPDITAMTKDIATPAQAMRQVDLLTKAGASKAAIESFKRAAKVKFGENWQSGTDDLTPILQKSLDQARQTRPSS